MNKKILKERKRKIKSNKGITLIALIITIVVLLILAVVSIGAVKDSNIIGHAQKASNDYKIEQEKEQIGLAVSEWQLEKVIPGNEAVFRDVIEGALPDTARIIAETDNGNSLTIEFENTGNQYTVESNGIINIVTPEAPVEPEPNDPVNPEEPDDPEEVVTVGVKAYSVDGATAIFTPDNKVNLFYSSSSVIPDQTFDVIETSREEITENLGIPILGFDDGEDENLIFLTGENFAGVATNDRNKLYMATEDETTGNTTISKSVYVEHQDALLAQYYHDSSDYEYFIGDAETGLVYINYTNEDIKIYLYLNGAYNAIPAEYIKDINIEPNTTELTINVDDSQVTLTSDAKKISFTDNNSNEIVYYLQEGNLYWGGLLTGVNSVISNSAYVFERGIKYGVITKFINTGALPTE